MNPADGQEYQPRFYIVLGIPIAPDQALPPLSPGAAGPGARVLEKYVPPTYGMMVTPAEQDEAIYIRIAEPPLPPPPPLL